MTRKPHQPLDFSAHAEVGSPRAPEPELVPMPQAEADEGPFAEPDLDLEIADEAIHFSPVTVQVAEGPEGSVTRRPETPPRSAERMFRPAPAEPKSDGRLGYGAALVFSLIWAGGLIMFWLGYQGRVAPLDFQPLALTVLGLLAAAPIALAWMLAYVLRQAMHVAAEARYARSQAVDMLQPAALASAGAGSAVEAVRQEIDKAAAAAAQARHELKTLSEVLASETAKLIDAAAASARTASSLTTAFAHERSELGALGASLDAQAGAVVEAINSQAEMVSQASDLAETQIREAEAALAARAADLAAAAGETTEAARLAGEDLSRQTARLEAAGTGVSEQIRVVEESLAEQRAALVAASHSLRAEQEDFAAQIESQQAQLSEILSQAQGGTAELEDTAARGGEALRQLVAQATDQYRELADAAAEERDIFGATALQSVGALSEAVRHERDLLQEETQQAIEAMTRAAGEARTAATSQAEAARQHIDELSEAAFAAGQKADTAFEARLAEARALIEQSAELVEDAGRRAGERLSQSLAGARETVEEIEAMLRDVEARTARMPAEAEAQGAQVKAAVEQGVDDLLATARKAAEETQAIDQAFQERVHRNYEMLSEAVRLMGVVSGAASPARPLRSSVRAEGMLRGTSSPSATGESTFDGETGDGAPRARLKLTPTATDEEFSTVFEQASGRETPEPATPTATDGQEWTWKDLLSSIDETPDGEERLADRLIAEIGALGIDPTALMPRPRIEEIAAALQTGDQQGAREVVRKLAPAAVRRLSRRILTDISLRSTANRFLKRYESVLDDAAARDREGFATTALLNTDQGRAFLLIDAAVGDLA